MNELVEIFGLPKTLMSRILFFGLLGVGTVSYLLARWLAHEALAPEPWLVQTLLWAIWLLWQGHYFNKHRDKYLARHSPRAAYRAAFYRDILPGASCAFALMMWPLMSVVASWPMALQPTWLALAWAVPLVLLGVGLLAAAVHTIGVSGALFLREYVRVEQPLQDTSIYRHIRHPLFLGAVALSLGTAGVTGNTEAMTLGIVNLAIMPIYRVLEDRRQEQVYGEHYRRYRASVNAFVPTSPFSSSWLRWLPALFTR